MSAPVEFPSSPDYESNDEFGTVYSWHGVFAVDLRWVAGARPYHGDQRYTEFFLAGGGINSAIQIKCPYPDFMRMWTDHMEGRT